MVLILNAFQTLGISVGFFILFIITRIYNYSVLSIIFLVLALLFLLKVGMYYYRQSQIKQKKQHSIAIINDLSQNITPQASTLEKQ